MHKDNINKRKEERIKIDKLPEEIKKFYLHFSNGDECLADIVDVSFHGLGILAKLDLNHFIVGTNIVIYPIGKDYAMYGKIIHASQISPNLTRVGIILRQTNALTKYKKILKEVMHKTSIE